MAAELQAAQKFNKNVNEIRQDYEAILIPKGKTDLKKVRMIKDSLSKIQSKYHSTFENRTITPARAITNAEDRAARTQKIINKMESSLIKCFTVQSQAPKQMRCIKWKAAVGNRPMDGNVITFNTIQDEWETKFERTDFAMNVNTGRYETQWQINATGKSKATIGLCNSSVNTEGMNWLTLNNYVGWSVGHRRASPVKNGVMVGFDINGQNEFPKDCKFVGKEILPKAKVGDIVAVVYDSCNGILHFKFNGKLIDAKIVNLPKEPLFWFAARWGSVHV